MDAAKEGSDDEDTCRELISSDKDTQQPLGPRILSLAEWQVELSDAVRDYLEQDLAAMDNHVGSSSSSTTTSSSCSTDRILHCMKVPPATTVLRWSPPLWGEEDLRTTGATP
jgi:hypothetical protein